MNLSILCWSILLTWLAPAAGAATGSSLLLAPNASSYFETDQQDNKAPYLNWLEQNSYAQHVFLPSADATSGAAVFWNIVEEEDSIEVAVAVQAEGWIGFGISEAGGMLGADVALFRTAAPKEVKDSFIVEQRYPQTDVCQNWNLTNAVIQQGWIIVEMKRLLDTKDPQDHAILNDSVHEVGEHRLIAAWGDSSDVGYHGMNRAKLAVQLFPSKEPGQENVTTTTISSSSSSSNTATATATATATLEELADVFIDIREDEYKIPAQDTKYVYKCFTWKDLQETFGLEDGQSLTMIGYKPIITPETEPFIHHFVLYGSNSATNCDSDELISAWAPGQQGMRMPDNVGISMFGGQGQFQSLGIQIHYNNPGMIQNQNQLDSSGIRLFFTNTPREHEAAMLVLGDLLLRLEGTEIGDGLSKWEFSCGAACSTFALKGDPVTILWESLHMHQTGVRMTNEVIRNDQVVRVGSAEVFEFDQQGSMLVQQESFQVQPGDAFRTTCYYRDGAEFGLSSQDEMCQAYLMYYPKKRLQWGSLDFPWICTYGINTPICSETLATQFDLSELDLGRKFGTPSNQCVAVSNTTIQDDVLPEERSDEGTSPTAGVDSEDISVFEDNGSASSCRPLSRIIFSFVLSFGFSFVYCIF